MNKNNSLLPKEAAALVHHIELNKAGWWQKTIDRLVMATVFQSDDSPSAEQIQVALYSSFKLTVAAQKLSSTLDSLESRNMLLRLPNKTYRIPEVERRSFEIEIAEAKDAERMAAASFCALVSQLDVDLVPGRVWEIFNCQFLEPPGFDAPVLPGIQCVTSSVRARDARVCPRSS